MNGRLGLELQKRGYELHGRALDGDFAKLSFSEQVEHIAADLRELSDIDAPLIANSWGAYWALHAILQIQECHARILLISPILGAVRGEGRMFKPPLSKVMERSIDERLFPDINLTVLVGSEDWQSPRDRCEALCSALQGDLIVAEGRGHDLGREVVTDLLNKWL